MADRPAGPTGVKVLSVTPNADGKTATVDLDWDPALSDPDEFRSRYSYEGPDGPWKRIARTLLPVKSGEASRAKWRSMKLDADAWVSVITVKGGIASKPEIVGPFRADAPLPEPEEPSEPTPEEPQPPTDPEPPTKPEPPTTTPPVPTQPRGWVGQYGGPKAPWNRKASEFGKHPDGASLTDLLYNKGPDRAGNFNVNWQEYTYPLYNANEADGTRTIQGSASSALNGTKVPWNSKWVASKGSDAQVVILNPTTGEEWNLWQIKVSDTSITVSNGSKVGGNYHTKEDGNKPSRGIGVQYGMGLITADELLAGVIPHAGSMPVNSPDGRYAFAPATKVEHPSSTAGVPEGARYALDVTDAEIETWLKKFPDEAPLRRALKAIAVMCRDYGWFITDTSGAASLQIEDQATSLAKLKQIGLVTGSGGARTAGVKMPDDILDGLFTKDRIYAVAEYGPRVTKA